MCACVLYPMGSREFSCPNMGIATSNESPDLNARFWLVEKIFAALWLVSTQRGHLHYSPSVSSSSGFVNLTMLLLSCNLRCRWLFYINLVERLPFIFYFRRWHNLLVVRTWDWKRILSFYSYLFIYFISELVSVFISWRASVLRPQFDLLFEW